ncbi:luc7-like protein 3 isoform X1 [Macrosteles quadrilineatus]|uniref:luc7-like protein 3 isoform X1 n=1 Tax=Macrosteles quadrilineatus TaxID=74068 RepID=UPI0023E17DD9|nr:luc7-like protein 3 isoform X1 [Macrosteles quadrilineatus]XP_054282924.1 luc7-like protein 3 isoform X1 [Macrosteles quadrilineatus]
MAVLAAAQLLDELMGRNRNVAPSEKAKELNWEDPDYCKFYMVKFCPHDLFVNTRADLGVCSKVHDDEAKALFDKSTSYKKQSYEDEFIRFSQAMLNEVERKIVKGKQRLALIGNKSEPPSSLSPQQTQRNQEQIALLSNKINSLVSEAEAAGIEGNVEQAQGLMKLCDQLKEEREALRKQNDNSHWSQTAEIAAAQEKQMEVCEVCGAFLIVGDAQSRIDDHLMGKQHVGFARLRMALEEIMSERAKQRDEKERRRDEERRERHKMREEEEKKKEKDREERRKKREEEDRSKKHSTRDHANHRDRDWDRDGHGRHRDDRGSSRLSSKQRSHSRDRHQRDKERDRSRHEDRRKENGERERDRDRDRDRRRH